MRDKYTNSMNENKKLFSKYDKAVFIITPALFLTGALIQLWRGDIWLLKVWFTYKVIDWLYNYAEGLIKDNTSEKDI